MNHSKAFAEVVESSLEGFTGQSWQWNNPPSFGSLVTINHESNTIFGLVYQVKTGSMDPQRYPFAYQKTPEQLQKEQPQIFEFLKTTFSCISIGYQEKSGPCKHILCPKPPLIHTFIEPATSDAAKDFFYNDTYLHRIFESPLITNKDDLLLTFIERQKQLGILSEKKLSSIINSYSLLTGNEYRRIKLFLQRAEQLI